MNRIPLILFSNWLFTKVGLSFLLSVFFCFGFSVEYAQATENEHLKLSVGRVRDVPIPNAPANFKLGGKHKDLVKLQYNNQTKELRFDPQKEGPGTVIVQHPTTNAVLYEFTFNIEQIDLNRVQREISSLLKEIDGIQVKVMNNRVVVDGQILLPKDISRVHSVVKQYGDLATSLVTLSPAAQVRIAQFIERAIGNPEIHVRAVNGKFLLEGVAENAPERDRAEIIAKTYVPDVVVDEAVADRKVQERVTDVVINLINVRSAPDAPPSKIVQIVIHFVELQKDYTKGFRFQWTPDIGDGSSVQFTTGGRSVGGLTSTITGTITNLLPKLNWATQHGHARVLQSSSLIVEDGKSGSLNSFQRVPYQSVGKNGFPVVNHEQVGLRTNITPRVVGARSDTINLDMSFAISALLGSTAAGPMTSNREITTQVGVRSGQSAAIGGLISNDTSTGYNRLPANASTNPLISLYASKDFQRNQSQFVVFVTPIIKTSASSGVENTKRKFRLRD